MTDFDTPMTSGRVTSRDGTPIGYLKTGRGPAVVILHGSMESARSHTLLAEALAGDFTVYLPDRRGRGMSGPHRPDHSVRTEVEDLQAVLAESGARLVFGVSAGGLVSWRPLAPCPASARSPSTSRRWPWTPPGTLPGWSASTARWPAARWRPR
jgi:pimeloyl-ACP methyl ester carboxylesterase